MAKEQRLIDAMDYVTQISKKVQPMLRIGCSTRKLYDTILGCIADAPTVDAVEVVRCEKCQHWNKRYETKGICLKHNSIVTFTSPNFYCACGERREGE